MNLAAVHNFIRIIKGKPWQYRLKIKDEPLPEKWSQWLGHPTPNYLEAEIQGPYSMNDIEWIDINPMELRKEGRLMPVKEIDHATEIIQSLKGEGIHFTMTAGIVRVVLSIGSK